MQDYRNLYVWQKAHKLTLSVFAITPHLKTPEAWPLRDQALRAAISITSNIAEGKGRRWVPVTNLSMICFWRGNSHSCPPRRIPIWRSNWRRFGAC